MIDVDKALATAVKTGKIVFGSDEAIRSAKTGKARLIVVASNNPSSIREDLEYYGKLSQIPIVTYRGNNVDLGIVCGKRFAIAALTVKEPGDSDILKLTEPAKPAEDDTAAEEEAEES
jgi:large subunit ribosomal protein L30e